MTLRVTAHALPARARRRADGGARSTGLTVKHADNNDFTAIVAGSEYMMGERKGFSEEQQTSAETIRYSALRIARDIGQITNLETAPVTTIVGGRRQCPLGLWAGAHCDAVTSNTVRQTPPRASRACQTGTLVRTGTHPGKRLKTSVVWYPVSRR